jgi:TM2 domain-containing membrane protein YozV
MKYRKKWIALIITVLGGWLGIHKFYLGEYAAGILYLLFFWSFIPAFIAIFDFFWLLFASETKFNHRYNWSLVEQTSQSPALSQNTFQSPSYLQEISQSQSQPQEIEEVIKGKYKVYIFNYLKIGWQIFRQQLIAFIGYIIFIAFINFTLQQFPYSVSAPTAFLINPPLTAGIFVVAFKVLQNKSTNFIDIFQGFQNWGDFVIASFLIGVFITVGILLFVIPGIYLSVSYIFVFPIIVDREFSFSEAMKASRKIINKHWFGWFAFSFFLLVCNIIGGLLFGFGWLITGPISICATAVAYQQVVGLQNQNL